jgi:hypothetical protein
MSIKERIRFEAMGPVKRGEVTFVAAARLAGLVVSTDASCLEAFQRRRWRGIDPRRNSISSKKRKESESPDLRTYEANSVHHSVALEWSVFKQQMQWGASTSNSI